MYPHRDPRILCCTAKRRYSRLASHASKALMPGFSAFEHDAADADRRDIRIQRTGAIRKPNLQDLFASPIRSPWSNRPGRSTPRSGPNSRDGHVTIASPVTPAPDLLRRCDGPSRCACCCPPFTASSQRSSRHDSPILPRGLPPCRCTTPFACSPRWRW